jgi:hypothetical protein
MMASWSSLRSETAAPFGASDIVVAASATDEALGAALIDALEKSE